MTGGNAARRDAPTLFDSGLQGGAARKLNTVKDKSSDLEPIVPSESLSAENNRSDSFNEGEGAETSMKAADDNMNYQNADREQADAEAMEHNELTTMAASNRRNRTTNLVSAKPVRKRAKLVGKVAKNRKTKNKVVVKADANERKKAVLKRKTRLQIDRIKANTPLATPFYVETGVEWNHTNIDFDELNVLRSLWELPAACHILWLLQSPLTLRFYNTLLEYEAALLKPEESPVLEDVFTKLLLKKSERMCLSAGIGLKYEWWNKQLRIYYLDMYDKWYALLRKAGERVPETFSQDEDDDDSCIGVSKTDEQVDVELTDDEWLTLDILKARLETLGAVCPLKHQSYADLSIELRCKILLNLCEAVIDDPANTEYMRQMEEDDLRVEPLGNDRAGNLYYFFPQFFEERRLYRLDPETHEWGLWVKGDDAFRLMFQAIKEIRGRKISGEQELLNHLEVIVEQIDDENEARARQLEKANRLAILEAIPRKRSLRLQVKQLEILEKHQEDLKQQKEMSKEAIAEMKRAELLEKVEREDEKEVRDFEREARRLHREQLERDSAQSERKERWLRRTEKEEQEEIFEHVASMEESKIS
ncbi:exosome complex exonuclease rrp6-like protein [Plasmopara halstedii]|uniref:Exosome complex exonuclease rrp6-like protein n=1 Tax=Plasmopara halstedii TaxID=4781 RepID=A0A0N7L3U6_PLAHL|nr:exosome complex exonuclease rrp6-like protein [Plasmopara halstedii]CEG36859.1 exosome complex exonuclease rrp6-like protein [Plasmopara halstedii]|eukprot:XP_024573228.1 exosome complex exonuclease rrp6-like protein [Plasmopara halstedii]